MMFGYLEETLACSKNIRGGQGPRTAVVDAAADDDDEKNIMSMRNQKE
jgi:hypothetical protein